MDKLITAEETIERYAQAYAAIQQYHDANTLKFATHATIDNIWEELNRFNNEEEVDIFAPSVEPPQDWVNNVNKAINVYLFTDGDVYFTHNTLTEFGDKTLDKQFILPAEGYNPIFEADEISPWYEGSDTNAKKFKRVISDWVVLPSKSFYLFYECSNLEDISGCAYWNMSGATDLWSLFSSCSKITDVSPLANWNVSNVGNMNYIFSYCKSVSSFTPLNNWNVSNVHDKTDAFSGTTGTKPSWWNSSWGS